MHFRFLWQLQQTHALTDMLNKSLQPPSTEPSPKAGSSTALVPAGGQADQRDSDAAAAAAAAAAAVAEHEKIVSSLGQMIITFLRFNVEVVSRAKAQNCVHMFFERYSDQTT